MLRRYWLAVLVAGVMLAARQVDSNQKVILWDRAAPQTTTVASGTLALALERGGGDTNPGPLFYGTPFEGQTPDGRPGLQPTGLLAPGDVIHRVLVIKNTGTLDAMVTSVTAAQTDGSRALADRLQLVITTDAAGAQPIVWGSLSQFIARPQFFATGVIELKAGESVILHAWVSLPRDLGNQYQNLRSVISIGVGAEQRRNNTPPPPPVQPPQLG